MGPPQIRSLSIKLKKNHPNQCLNDGEKRTYIQWIIETPILFESKSVKIRLNLATSSTKLFYLDNKSVLKKI